MCREVGRISKNREKCWKREERRARSPAASERYTAGTDMEERWDWETDEEEKEGRNKSWLPAVRNRRGKPSWTLDDERLLRVFLSYFSVSPFTKHQIHFFFKPQVRENQESWDPHRLGNDCTRCFHCNRGERVQSPLLQTEFRPSEQNQHSQPERLNPDIQAQTFTRLCSFVSIF